MQIVLARDKTLFALKIA